MKRKASTQILVLTTAQNSYDKIIQIKRCTEPTEDLRQIHNALKQQKSKPFKQIKFVAHTNRHSNKLKRIRLLNLVILSCNVGQNGSTQNANSLQWHD